MSTPIRTWGEYLHWRCRWGVQRKEVELQKCKSGCFVAEMGRITPLLDGNSEHFDLRVRSGHGLQVRS